jgi:TPR repeat protein
MNKIFALLLVLVPFCASGHSLTTDTPFANGLSHFRDGDFQTAYEEWSEGAEQADSGAQFGLGLMYYSGQGFEQDFAEAYEWMLTAAKNGNFNAQNNLGVMYLQGQGIEKDLVRAFAWYSVAAAQGQKDAQTNVDILSEQLSPAQRAESDTLIASLKEKYVVW